MKTKCKQCRLPTDGKKFCSHRCKWTWHNRNRTLKPNAIYDCKVCGKRVEKWVSPATVRAGVNTLEYCSRTCAGIGRSGRNHFNWKGGRCFDKFGYVMVHKPDHPHASKGGYVREHRLVMEQHIKRFLLPSEVVHHINGDVSDNRIENLHLYETNADHKRDDSIFRERDSLGRFLPKR